MVTCPPPPEVWLLLGAISCVQDWKKRFSGWKPTEVGDQWRSGVCAHDERDKRDPYTHASWSPLRLESCSHSTKSWWAHSNCVSNITGMSTRCTHASNSQNLIVHDPPSSVNILAQSGGHMITRFYNYDGVVIYTTITFVSTKKCCHHRWQLF